MPPEDRPRPGADSGALFAGRYRIDDVVGRGGMATVYRAEDALLGRIVAIKELIEPLSDNRRGQQLVDEARAAASLSHPHIATVYDTFEEGGRRYIVMEYVGGGSLRDVLDRSGGSLDPARAIAIAYDIADALDYAHRLGIIHSDVKPQNILLDDQGRAKLVDFGIARAAAQTWALATTVMGSAAYLAPEQIEGGRPDPRSDLYSLGLVIYEALSGTLPFEADNPAALAAQRLVRDPVPLRIHAPEVTHGLESIVMRCITRDPNLRFATAWDLGAALDASRESDPTLTTPLAALPPTTPPPPPIFREEDDGPNWGARFLVIAVLLLAIAVGAASAPAIIDSLGDDDDGGSAAPTVEPGASVAPSETPTAAPTATSEPTEEPTDTPTAAPTEEPTDVPTEEPTEPPPTATPDNPFAAAPTAFPEAGRPVFP